MKSLLHPHCNALLAGDGMQIEKFILIHVSVHRVRLINFSVCESKPIKKFLQKDGLNWPEYEKKKFNLSK